MVSSIKDLELKRQFNGSLRLMEERQYALLVRQVSKMDEEAARLDEEARIKVRKCRPPSMQGCVCICIRGQRAMHVCLCLVWCQDDAGS
jgi:hypothetical protein